MNPSGKPTNAAVETAEVEELEHNNLPAVKTRTRAMIGSGLAKRNVYHNVDHNKLLRREYLVQWLGEDNDTAEWRSRAWLGPEEGAGFDQHSWAMDTEPPIYRSR